MGALSVPAGGQVLWERDVVSAVLLLDANTLSNLRPFDQLYLSELPSLSNFGKTIATLGTHLSFNSEL